MAYSNTHPVRRRALTLSLSIAASIVLLFALLTGRVAETVQADSGDTPTPEASVEPSDTTAQQMKNAALVVFANPPEHPNIDSNLNQIIEEIGAGQLTSKAVAEGAPVHKEDSVAVTLYVVEGYAEEISDFLSDNGASPRNVGVDYIEAYVPVSLLEVVSQQDGVIRIETITSRQATQSQSGGEGVAAHGANVWHEEGFRGNGVKIGVIDDFDGFSALMGTELPSSVHVRCFTDIGVFTSNRVDCEDFSDHGTAITEILFDLAPEAAYYLSNPGTRGDLKTAVEWMVVQDVDVIQYGSSWAWEGPGDGSTPFSNGALRSVDAAVEGGAVWVNGAGNDNLSTWFGSPDKFEFDDSDFSFQIFGGNDDTCNNVLLASGERFTAHLRWEDTWGGSTRNIDLVLFDPAIEIVASSIDVQSGRAEHDPFEWLSYTAAVRGPHCLVVVHNQDTEPAWLQLQAFTRQDLQYHTAMGSIANPAESANAGLLAVGAAPWNSTVTIEDFSSRGPTPDGRVKPDIVGSDGTYSVARDRRWYGTSQSSAHVAGLAALVRQRFSDDTPEQVVNYLKGSAEARGTVPNNTWGYGFAMLPESVVAEPHRYDLNRNGTFEKEEVLVAINDYLFGDGQLTKEQVLEIITAYLFG